MLQVWHQFSPVIYSLLKIITVILILMGIAAVASMDKIIDLIGLPIAGLIVVVIIGFMITTKLK